MTKSRNDDISEIKIANIEIRKDELFDFLFYRQIT